jgi:hypothetical protein
MLVKSDADYYDLDIWIRIRLYPLYLAVSVPISGSVTEYHFGDSPALFAFLSRPRSAKREKVRKDEERGAE